MNKQANVPPMMIKNAAGLFKDEIGAPLSTMPTKIDTKPKTIPITVDFSKTKSPLP